MIVILNAEAGPASNSGDEIRTTLGDAFGEAGIHADIVEVHGSDRLVGALRKALRKSTDTVVAAGGDGTVSTVAAHVAGTDRRLGVLPLGTLNHFAKDVGVPLELGAAVRTLAKGQTKPVDVAEVNGRLFINNSCLGICPPTVAPGENLQQQLNRSRWSAFVSASILAFRRFPFLNLSVSIGGRELRRKTAFLFVGNNEYEMTGFGSGARPRLDGGKLGLCTTRQMGRLGLLRLGFRALRGQLEQSEDFDAFGVDEALIESRDNRLLVSTDGEMRYLRPPLRFRARPGALQVIVPAEA